MADSLIHESNGRSTVKLTYFENPKADSRLCYSTIDSADYTKKCERDSIVLIQMNEQKS
jgi:hypothetical protein